MGIADKAKKGWQRWRMLAGEYLPLARLFDRVEVRLRGLGRWVKGSWAGSPKAAGTLIVLAIVACMAALAYLLF
jgi:hypothetical protein